MTDALDGLRRQAKNLQKSYEAGDTHARDRVRAHSPRPGGVALKRADFLHVIAQENSYASWPDMKLAVQTQGLDRATKLQRLKLALAHGQNTVVAALLQDTPDLADGHFGLQVALLDSRAVLAALAQNPSLAVRLAGPRRPMLHLAFSRCIHLWPDRRDAMIEIARALVNAGADVNDNLQHEGQPLSALYGAIGHADNMVLARWLLANGANPNDGESLYHATELGHCEGLEMLLEHGANPAGTNALLRAMDADDVEMVAMLLEAGADPNEHNADAVGGAHPTVIPVLHQAARRQVSDEMCRLLLDAGADPGREFQWASAYAFACVYGHRGLARMIADRGPVPDLSPAEQLLAQAAQGQVPPGTYLDEAQLPPAYAHIIRDILPLPGKLAHLRALVDLGMYHDKVDSEGLTPVQVAGWEGLPDILEYMLSLKPDLSHVNGYGGTLLSTIVHGSENNPARGTRNYVGCARLALDAGVALPRRMPDLAGDPVLSAFLADWAAAHPGQVVDA